MSAQKKKIINVITLGCSKNLVDSEKIMGQLSPQEYEIRFDSEDANADIVLINTCGFINDAKQESIDTILEALEARKKGLVSKVMVTGCLSERYKNDLAKEMPEVDAYFGVHDIEGILNNLGTKYDYREQEKRFITTPSHYAYLKIAEGCDRTCSFCAIPMIRGPYISQPIESLVKEARMLVASGAKELLLIAQDITYYGLDIYKKPALASLLEKLLEIEGLEWIRLHYAYPTGFSMDVIDLMARDKRICRYLDIPFQHINDGILKSMRRGVDAQETLRLIDAVRSKVPDIALRTSLIVGYPGEGVKEFNELMRFVEKVKFERLGVFTYSPEEDTRAFKLGDTVSDKTKRNRADRLMELQSKISLDLNLAKVGREFKVLVDRKEDDLWIGRTEYDSPEVDNEVIIQKVPARLNLKGQFVNVKVHAASEFDLEGRLCQSLIVNT